MGEVKLGVNVDHVATVREARKTVEPDPVAAAFLAELGGADGITVHLRMDRRHIKPRDLHLLRQVVRTRLNLEMANTEGMIKTALEVKPDQVTLVPEKPSEVTTEGGLDVVGNMDAIADAVKRIQECGIRVSIFIDPDPAQVKAAKESGADCIEIHTGLYASAITDREQGVEYRKILEAAQLAQNLGLVLNAGHGLNYMNVKLIASIPGMNELNIGHSIVARAVLVGMERAVREMKELLK
jgi:pyridoxine 5-phosphate synthase